MSTLSHIEDAGVTTFTLLDVISISSVRMAGLNISQIETPKFRGHQEASKPRYPPDAIAVLGMGCKHVGADSTDKLFEVVWDGLSMHERLPETNNLQEISVAQEWGASFGGNLFVTLIAPITGSSKVIARGCCNESAARTAATDSVTDIRVTRVIWSLRRALAAR